MASIVSGLGRLFHPATSSLSPHTPRGHRQLESVTEEAHTYDLLYPETGSLRRTQHHTFPLKHGDPSSIAAAANSFDDRGGLNLQHSQDVRFIIAQYIGGQPSVLFDTEPSPLLPGDRKSLDSEIKPPSDVSRMHGGMQRSRTAPHSRQSSLSQNAQSTFGSSGLPLSPVSEMSALFGRESKRPMTSDSESIQGQLSREHRQETDAILSSIFGATGHRVSAGTKVHVKPYNPLQTESTRPVSPGNTRHGSQRRRTPLTRSTTAEDLHSFGSQNSSSAIRQPPRPQSSSVLVTKIFYLDSADEGLTPAMEERKSEPINDRPSNTQSSSKKPRSRSSSNEPNGQTYQKHRTPAFAIAMVIYIPLHQHSFKILSNTRASPALGQYSSEISSELVNHYALEAFDRSVEYIMAHWDMITRALSSLEIIVRCNISDELSQLEIDSPSLPNSTSSHAPSLRPSRIRVLPLLALQLSYGSLQHSAVIQKAVEVTSRRIVSALQTRGVAVGQGRWGIWREEARGVEKWAGGREQGFFLFNLLTAFLGNHTEWLDIMSSKLSRGKRPRSFDRSQQQDRNTIRHRTVIVSLDKMAARRLVFLLSAFLSPSPLGIKRHEESISEVSTSFPALSTSPLIGSPISRQISLRKALSKGQFDHFPKDRKNSENTTLDPDAATEISDDRTITESPIIHRRSSHTQHARSSSDTASARGIALPISMAGSKIRSAGTTTTAAVQPETAMPVAHFSSFLPEPRLVSTTEQRPGSSGSIASLALHRTLSRSDSVDHSGTSAESQSTGRWFWNSRRGSSTETSETPTSSAEGLGIFVPKDLRASRPTDRLSCMVEDALFVAGGQNTPRTLNDALHEGMEASSRNSDPKEIPRGRDVLEPFPLNLSVNESDGVIDVKLPSLESQASSFGSRSNSPQPSRINPGGVKEGLQPWCPSMLTSPTLPLHRSSHSVSEVGGWLRKFHQDLALQAVQPYDTLMEEVKFGMRTEPTSTISPNKDSQRTVDEWTDVCTSLIADITTFTLTRLTLRRKNAHLCYHRADALLGHSTKENPDEEFFEESLIEHDATLTEAVEKILSHSGSSSHIASQGASRVASRRTSPTRAAAYSGEKTPPLEVPKSECKKMVLGALEQVAKSVRNEMMGNEEFKSQYDGEAKDPLREGVRRWFEEVGLTTRGKL